MDDNGLRRWMAIEARAMNAGLTTVQRPLATLLGARDPTLPTQSGAPHRFDRDALAAFAVPLSPFMRGVVLLPIRFYVSHDHASDATVADAEAAQALLEAGLVRTRPRNGRLWLTVAKARELAGRFPTVFQFVYI